MSPSTNVPDGKLNNKVLVAVVVAIFNEYIEEPPINNVVLLIAPNPAPYAPAG